MSYDASRAMATRLIAAKGRMTAFERLSVVHDPATAISTSSVSSYSLPAVALPVSPERAKRAGTMIEKVSTRFIVASAGSDSIPEIGDIVDWPSGKMTLITVDTIDPDGSGAVVSDCLAGVI